MSLKGLDPNYEPTDCQRLTGTLHILSERFTLLRMRITVENSNQPRFEEMDDSKSLEFQTRMDIDSENWMSAFNEQINCEPFDNFFLMHTHTYTIYITLANTKNVIQLRRKKKQYSTIQNRGIKERKIQINNKKLQNINQKAPTSYLQSTLLQ